MRTPANSFDRADKALCRAHGDAVHEHYPMPPFTTAEVRHFKEAFSYRASVNAFEQGVHMPTDAPLPPTYDQDLDEWLRECEYFAQLRLIKPSTRKWLHGEFDMHSLGAADNAAHGDAYVSAKQPDQSEVWHSEPPAVAGVYIASMKKLADTRRYWNGSQWSQPWYGQTPRHECKSQTTDVVGIQWLRLIEADKPAETAAPAAAEYSVCIKAHGMAEWLVGDVQPGSPDTFAHPGNWLPCDKDGWVSHTPTADSVCPVPEGVEAEIQFENGCFVQLSNLLDIDGYAPWDVKKAGRAAAFVFHSELGYGAISAWRPTGATA